MRFSRNSVTAVSRRDHRKISATSKMPLSAIDAAVSFELAILILNFSGNDCRQFWAKAGNDMLSVVSPDLLTVNDTKVALYAGSEPVRECGFSSHSFLRWPD